MEINIILEKLRAMFIFNLSGFKTQTLQIAVKRCSGN